MADDPYTHTDPRVDPSSRWYWPDAPSGAGFHGNHPGGVSGYGWNVEGIPPEPWPYAGAWPVDAFGPPGTIWRCSATAYLNRLALGSGTLSEAAARRLLLLNKLPSAAGVFGASVTWTTPGLAPDFMTIDALRGTIHGQVGTLEETCNVLHYITDPEVAITDAIVHTFGDKLVTQWGAFMDTPLTSGPNVHTLFSNIINWYEVRAAHVQIVGPVVKWAPGTNTYFAPLSGIGAGSAPLPNQVAAVVTLLTGVRVGKHGASGRGRTYLGPLGTGIIGTDALIPATVARDVVNAWHAAMIDGMDAGTDKFKLVVLSPKTDARYLVTSTRMGRVPDTQRRRRKSLPELYQSGG